MQNLWVSYGFLLLRFSYFIIIIIIVVIIIFIIIIVYYAEMFL